MISRIQSTCLIYIQSCCHTGAKCQKPHQHVPFFLALKDRRIKKHPSFMFLLFQPFVSILLYRKSRLSASMSWEQRIHTQIHALAFNGGLLSIFVTINPADIHSHICFDHEFTPSQLKKSLKDEVMVLRTTRR